VYSAAQQSRRGLTASTPFEIRVPPSTEVVKKTVMMTDRPTDRPTDLRKNVSK